jgi:hypothetical protein
MLSGGKIQFSTSNWKSDCTKRVMRKIDIKCDDTIASDYKLSQQAACSRYVNYHSIANYQLFWQQHEQLGVLEVKLGLNSKANELNSRIPAQKHQFLDIIGERMEVALSVHRTFNLHIDLKDGTDSCSSPIYAWSAVDLKAVRQNLDEILRIDTIRLRK